MKVSPDLGSSTPAISRRALNDLSPVRLPFRHARKRFAFEPLLNLSAAAKSGLQPSLAHAALSKPFCASGVLAVNSDKVLINADKSSKRRILSPVRLPVPPRGRPAQSDAWPRPKIQAIAARYQNAAAQGLNACFMRPAADWGEGLTITGAPWRFCQTSRGAAAFPAFSVRR